MQYYRIECNSLCKWSYCTNHSTFPKWGKGDRRLTAVDEDVLKMQITVHLFVLSNNSFFIRDVYIVKGLIH